MSTNPRGVIQSTTDAQNIAEGIYLRLADTSGGRRSIRWLSEQAGLKYSTLKHKLSKAPENFNVSDLIAICDVFGIELWELPVNEEAAA